MIDAAQSERAVTAASGLLLIGLAIFALSDRGPRDAIGHIRRSRAAGLLILLGCAGGVSVAVSLGI